jgi:hypothetical protein
VTEWRSKFEGKVGAVLPVGTKYEPKQFKFPISDPGYRCRLCASKEVERTTSYTPDFLLPNGTWIEAKGRLTGANRRRLVAWKAYFPNETLRMVLMADNKLSKTSKTRYSDWCKKAGFEYCVGYSKIPGGWLK